ncbi:CLUMA_CG007626, isoform A [Clunio marinus]|uniref:CLUMA_CG007626, isoform A n=1 Tax=Clunio marinus TaxID=568069 RepID=A0A1J1I177_9DIPT|nr:CLUMA_CG007626, isoform A [Clunio marinus]
MDLLLVLVEIIFSLNYSNFVLLIEIGLWKQVECVELHLKVGMKCFIKETSCKYAMTIEIF